MESSENDLFAEEIGKMTKQAAKGDGTTIAEHNRALIERADVLLDLGYISPDIYELLCKACEYHDLGKANPRMQERLKNSKVKFNPDKEIPHNVLSMYLIPWEDSQEYLILEFAVGFHHDYCDVFYMLENPECKKLAEELLAEWKCARAPSRREIKKIIRGTKEPHLRDKMILVKGLLHKCDYAASANVEIEYKNDFLQSKMEEFSIRKGYVWNEMQKFCAERQDKNLIVVGQTGMGKTEASLLWLGNHKGFIFLPVKTAINKMYDRISGDILISENPNEIEQQLGLLHSDAVSKLLEGLEKREQTYHEMDVMEYNSRSRQLAMPITISTVDQLFDFVFQYQTYELKLATLSYSKIVIDEIQMYGADLLADLIYGLKRIRQIGGKIAITTATLAPFVRELLEEDVGEFEYGVFYDKTQIRHRVKLLSEQINPNVVVEKFRHCMSMESEEEKGKYTEQGNKGGKILVICNTIKKAQWLYQEICRQIKEEEMEKVCLLHSKFIRQDRAQKEKSICECGKFECKDTVIWISTSLVEASLDIDFDYLFTELQDLSSLLQRMGRVNRKGKKSIHDYNCFVYTEIEEKYLEIPYTMGNDREHTKTAFIDRDFFELSKTALEETLAQENDGELSESCKIEMIEKYFTKEKLQNTNYMQKYRQQMEKLESIELYEVSKKDVRIREDIHTKDIIPYCIYKLHEEEINSSVVKLKAAYTSMADKIKERNNIMQYTIPIQNYIVRNYYKAVGEKKAILHNPIQTGIYDRIDVIDCDYDDKMGFQEKKFDKIEDEPIFV